MMAITCRAQSAVCGAFIVAVEVITKHKWERRFALDRQRLEQLIERKDLAVLGNDLAGIGPDREVMRWANFN